MKLAIASALILALAGNTSAFSAAPVKGRSSALHATATETYTFTKSEEIFAEAKEVRLFMRCLQIINVEDLHEWMIR